MSKLSDMVISGIIKRGILLESKNVNFTIPYEGSTISVNAEDVTIKVEKENKNG